MRSLGVATVKPMSHESVSGAEKQRRSPAPAVLASGAGQSEIQVRFYTVHIHRNVYWTDTIG